MKTETEFHWIYKTDIFRKESDYSDLIKIISGYYEMYSRAAEFIGPWIAKQKNGFFIIPDKDLIKEYLGKERPYISYNARASFIDSLISFLEKNKGRRTLITPNPSSHHSAQFPLGSFEITKEKQPVIITSEKGTRKLTNNVARIDIFGGEQPIFIENFRYQEHDVKFLIIRPKLGRLGSPNISRWEIMLYKNKINYLLDHVDSHLNPRYAGVF